MKANVGDKLVIMSRHLDEAVQEGEIIEVHGANGAPPYLVHWSEGEHEGLIFPGPDARIVPHRQTSTA